ncbi:hypothetical protein GCM10010924_55240 [Rhizobium wenxiniae]|nr:hypothetical protein GCM10010924_55240 [Rhizobium wenxiniae]
MALPAANEARPRSNILMFASMWEEVFSPNASAPAITETAMPLVMVTCWGVGA